MSDPCKRCGGVDNWYHDLTDCVARLTVDKRQLATQLAAALAQADLYKQGYEARGKILAAYRTGGRPSEKALDAAADVATKLQPLNPESGAKGEGGGRER